VAMSFLHKHAVEVPAHLSTMPGVQEIACAQAFSRMHAKICSAHSHTRTYIPPFKMIDLSITYSSFQTKRAIALWWCAWHY